MRLSFRGFFGYAKCLINLAAREPHHLLPRCRNGATISRNFALTPAHSTTSYIEAWFSLMRALGFDEATKYMSGVLNRMMSKGITRSLQNNSMYEEQDVGPIRETLGKFGPRDFARFLNQKRDMKDQVISSYRKEKKICVYKSPVRALAAACSISELTYATVRQQRL